MRVAVLGAPGARGLRVVRDLLERPDVAGVVLVGPDERDLSRLVGALDPRRVTAAPVPLTVEGIAEGLDAVDVAVGCMDGPPEAELTALEATMVAGVAYVTSCEDLATIRAMVAAGCARGSAGQPSVVGVSWSPGLSNLLVRAASERLDDVRSVRVAWYTSHPDEGLDGLDRLLLAWSGDAEVIEGGVRRSVAPGTSGEPVFFPEPVGWQRVHLVRGAEIATLPEALPGLEALRVEGGMGGSSVSTLAQMVARTEAPPAEGPLTVAAAGTTRRKLAVLTRGLALGLGPFGPRPTGWSGLRVDVGGRVGGSARVETYGVVDHLANLESGPLVTAALSIGQGDVVARGVLSPEAAFEPRRFLTLLAERGIRVARLER